jgi:hypothetical protein
MEAVSTSETSVNKTTRRNIPEDCHVFSTAVFMSKMAENVVTVIE